MYEPELTKINEIQKRIWDLIDYMAKYPLESKRVNPITWAHLSVYDSRPFREQIKSAREREGIVRSVG